ncbi:hypothetical protein PZE06_15620 [Robertmurraya sp. DFI.2.37]|uniref:hypothetical protein n=1 Tax=Robertmurraya sp. DFI.2.37 TaxID=3031819 RepID=UPI0012492D22|nr:hypothetical protein [Robertmurraya sp. DFI.2.37]MDF1509570.1 hypothetical protein [Robertmurraya sp. DFI.2.37]
MAKRFSMALMIMVLAIIALLLAAKNPTGPNTVSFDDPLNLWFSLGTLIVLLLPPLILSFFNHPVLNIIFAIYQGFVVLTFLGLILVGFLIPSIWIILIGALGIVIGISSIVMSFLGGIRKAY